jgi:hypothetical protein
MATSTVNKTQGTALLAWQDVATGNVVIGSAVTVDTKLAATVFCRLGRRTGTAFTAGWPNIRIELSAKSAGNDEWVPVATFQPAVGATIASTTLNGAVAAGATTFVVTSATNILAGDVLFLSDSSAANYEIVRVKAVSGTTVTPEEAVTDAHVTASIVTDQAEVYVAQVDLTAVGRIRAVADNASGGQAISVEVLMVTGDSLNTV